MPSLKALAISAGVALLVIYAVNHVDALGKLVQK